MRLTTFSDYCLRVLMFVGAKGDGLTTIDEIADGYGISRNHLMKVVFRLGQLGYLQTVRGKGGGMRLARDPKRINIGALIRETEEDLSLVQCFQAKGGLCAVEPACVLKSVLTHALHEFLKVLDDHTLADLLVPKKRLGRLLSIQS